MSNSEPLPPQPTPDAPTTAEPSAELSRWACEHGSTQWGWETERRRSLDGKAAQIIGAVSAVLLWSISEVGKLPPAGWLQVFMALTFVAVMLASALAAGLAFWCVRLTSVPYPNIAEAKDRSHRGVSLSMDASFAHYRRHLEAALARARELGERKARAIRAAELAAMIAIPAGVCFALLAKVASET